MQKNNKKFSKGFGILEVLISSAIIIVVLGTLVFIAQSSLMNAAYMQERAQAVSLAAEAIETIRQNRDSNYIDQNSETQWNTVGTLSNADVFNYLSYDFYTPSSLNANNRMYLVTNVVGRALPVIKIDGVNYTRKINFVSLDDTTLLTQPTNVANLDSNGKGNAFIAKVEVTWKGSGGKAGSVLVEELITNSRFVY